MAPGNTRGRVRGGKLSRVIWGETAKTATREWRPHPLVDSLSEDWTRSKSPGADRCPSSGQNSRGWRSGFATTYGSLTFGVTHKVGSLAMLRPEIRYERAFRPGVTPYDNGIKPTQLSFGMDYILDF